MGFFYYNSNLYNINLGVHIPDESENSLIFVEELKKGQIEVTMILKQGKKNEIRRIFKLNNNQISNFRKKGFRQLDKFPDLKNEIIKV